MFNSTAVLFDSFIDVCMTIIGLIGCCWIFAEWGYKKGYADCKKALKKQSIPHKRRNIES